MTEQQNKLPHDAVQAFKRDLLEVYQQHGMYVVWDDHTESWRVYKLDDATLFELESMR